MLRTHTLTATTEEAVRLFMARAEKKAGTSGNFAEAFIAEMTALLEAAPEPPFQKKVSTADAAPILDAADFVNATALPKTSQISVEMSFSRDRLSDGRLETFSDVIRSMTMQAKATGRELRRVSMLVPRFYLSVGRGEPKFVCSAQVCGNRVNHVLGLVSKITVSQATETARDYLRLLDAEYGTVEKRISRLSRPRFRRCAAPDRQTFITPREWCVDYLTKRRRERGRAYVLVDQLIGAALEEGVTSIVDALTDECYFETAIRNGREYVRLKE